MAGPRPNCEQNKNLLHSPIPPRCSSPMRLPYLERLNSAQRRAVEHGVGEVTGQPTRPLLVIAGAGSGKTSTLAHRVAHVIVSGADPRRILLMTFSRRAAAEMTRRAERILRSAMGGGAAGTADRLNWAGTFHAIGARLLRIYANEIGLDPAFTIHDREDSADLLNLVRHQLGFSKTPTRFPMKGTCLFIRAASTPRCRSRRYCG
jgi:DNA helicase II / ATP-dependent DNA helicase PcrA